MLLENLDPASVRVCDSRGLGTSVEAIFPSVVVTTPGAIRVEMVSNLDRNVAKCSPHFSAGTTELPQIDLVRLPAGAVLYGGSHLVRVGDTLLAEQLNTRSPLSGAKLANQSNDRDIVHVTDPCVIVVREGVATWGHWLAELLPKAVAVEAAFPNRFKFAVLDVFQVAERPSRWSAMRDSMLSYGIDRSRAVCIKDGKNYVFDALYAVTPLWARGLLHPGAGAAMRANIDIPADPASGSKRIFLLRNPEDGRGLSNLDELAHYFSSFSFAAVGKMKFLEQVSLFRSGSLFAGVLGSSFTGLLYAPEKVKVLSLAPKNFGDNFFRGLTCDRAGQFVELKGDVTTYNDRYPGSSDFRVETLAIEAALDRLGVVP